MEGRRQKAEGRRYRGQDVIYVLRHKALFTPDVKGLPFLLRVERGIWRAKGAKQ